MHPQDGRFDDGRVDQRRPQQAPQPQHRQGPPQDRQGPGSRPVGPAHGAPQPDPTRRGMSSRPFPMQGPDTGGHRQNDGRTPYRGDAPPTRAQPPGVLSGPGATANAAYSMMSDRGTDPSEAQTEIHDQYREHDFAPAQFTARADDADTAGDQESEAMTAAPRNSTNTLSIVALVLSFLGITSIFGVICAHIARRQIRESKEQGASLAAAALWIGYFYIGAAILCLVVYFAIAGQGS